MRLYKNNDLKIIMKVVSVNTNIPQEVIEEVFGNYYKEIDNLINSLEKENIEDYPVIKIPMFGKIYISKAKKRVLNRIFKERKKNGESEISS
jgi:hypothetical protein